MATMVSPTSLTKPEEAVTRPTDCTCREMFRSDVGFSKEYEAERRGHVLFANVLKRKRHAMYQYYLFRYSLHVILILQIIFGAVIATLGSVRGSGANNTVIALGAVQAVFAGL